jgi:hypothetical protein
MRIAPMLCGKDVQNGVSPRASMRPGHHAHQGGRIAAAAVVGVGADGADLGEAGQLQTLAGHGRQDAARPSRPTKSPRRWVRL